MPLPLRRPGDLAARFGGEEFAVILPGADLTVAATIAQRIVELVRDLAIPHEDSPSRVVTISVGVATMVPGPEDGDPTPLLERADRALYSAKRQGGNQISLSHPGDPVSQDMPRLFRPSDELGAAQVMAAPARR